MEEIGLVVDIDCTTGIVTERALTPEEIEARRISALEIAEFRKAEAEAIETRNALKESAKAKLVAGEPLTPEEAATIVL